MTLHEIQIKTEKDFIIKMEDQVKMKEKIKHFLHSQ